MTACSASKIVFEPLSHFAHSSSDTLARNSFTASSNACRAWSSPLQVSVNWDYEEVLPNIITLMMGLPQTNLASLDYLGRGSCSKAEILVAWQEKKVQVAQPSKGRCTDALILNLCSCTWRVVLGHCEGRLMVIYYSRRLCCKDVEHKADAQPYIAPPRYCRTYCHIDLHLVLVPSRWTEQAGQNNH